MENIVLELTHWMDTDKEFALATVIKTFSSSPRPVGAKMGVTKKLEICGSVSGGCIESAVIEKAQEVLKNDIPQRIDYGISNQMAWDIGLACGGGLTVFIEKFSPKTRNGDKLLNETLISLYQSKKVFALVTIVKGNELGQKMLFTHDGEVIGSLGNEILHKFAQEKISTMWDTGGTAIEEMILADNSQVELFFEVHLPPPTIYIVGAVHIAIPLVDFAKRLGFRTIVMDARSAFATKERFPHADELIVGWPAEILERLNLDRSSYLVCLTHDEKLDNPALAIGVMSSAAYIGALGSKNTHAKRVENLMAEGLSAEAIQRIHAPIGLKIGAKLPEEIALSIIAEIVSVMRLKEK